MPLQRATAPPLAPMPGIRPRAPLQAPLAPSGGLWWRSAHGLPLSAVWRLLVASARSRRWASFDPAAVLGVARALQVRSFSVGIQFLRSLAVQWISAIFYGVLMPRSELPGPGRRVRCCAGPAIFCRNSIPEIPCSAMDFTDFLWGIDALRRAAPAPGRATVAMGLDRHRSRGLLFAPAI